MAETRINIGANHSLAVGFTIRCGASRGPLSKHSVHLGEMAMSRGFGRTQRALFLIVRGSERPITFAEICGRLLQACGVNDPDNTLKPTFQRSYRRALKRLLDQDYVMAFGEGGPGDPRRYCLSPLLAAVIGKKGEYERVVAMVDADPGANIAYGKKMLQEMAKNGWPSHEGEH
jgi:hypothetical protein